MQPSVFHIRIDSAPGYNSNAIEKAWLDHGYKYFGFKWQEYRFNHGLENLRKRVVELAEMIQPTIIFAHVQNGEVFDQEVWKKLSQISYTINYTFDVRDVDRIRWMVDIAQIIGHTFFADTKSVDYCQSLNIKNVSHCHSSCDMDVFKSNNKSIYAYDIVFCGNNYVGTNLNFPLAEERQRMIEFLYENYGNSFMAFGLGQKGGLIQPEAEANVYNYSKIAISQNNFDLPGYTSDRLWRIMSCGTFCLAKHYDGVENDFNGNLVTWQSFSDLKSKIDRYILNSGREREILADKGSRHVRSNHSWHQRVKQMIDVVYKNLSDSYHNSLTR